jgi:hypothetical protein
MPTVNFRKAAERHYHDANLLDQHNRQTNAAHLYGLSGECAIKAIMVGCGMIHAGVPYQPPYKHINQLLTVWSSIGSGRQWPTFKVLIEPHATKFNDWDVNDRYCDPATINLSSYPAWKQAAQAIESIMIDAARQGVPL